MKFKSKINYTISYFVLMLSFFFATNFCLAALLNPTLKEKINTQANSSAAISYETTGNIYSLVQIIINAFLSIIGVLLLVYLLTAGYKWMTAHGEEEKVTEAKDTIKRAIVGTIIIVAAYAISVFVMSRLEAGVLKGTSGPTANPPAASTPAIPSNGTYLDPSGVTDM